MELLGADEELDADVLEAREVLETPEFPEEEIVATLSRQLGWSHFVELIPLKKHLQREYYAEMCRVERWSVRLLRQKIGGMLYERTALSKKPAKLPCCSATGNHLQI